MGRKLNLFRSLINWIRSLFEEKINWDSIDKSGVVLSDYPVVDKGWIKGWVSGEDEIIVCKHSNPVVGNSVYVIKDGVKIFRKIESVDNTYASDDVSICKLTQKWPAGVKIYKISKTIKKMQLMGTLHQDNTISLRRALLDDRIVFGTYYNRDIIAGDSGLPWFVWEDGEFKVCSHSHRGMWGIGPNYFSIF